MTTAREENERMLAAVLRLEPEDAAQRLTRSVAVTAADDPASARLAKELTEQLERTVRVATPSEQADLEVAIGRSPDGRAADKLNVHIDDTSLTVATSKPSTSSAERTVDGLRMTFAGCYAAAPILHRLLGMEETGYSPVRDPFVVKFGALGIPDELLDRPLEFTDVALAGAGAIGNGFLRALRDIPAVGTLPVIDPKRVGQGNANRCLYFNESDINAPKAPLLAARARQDFAELMLEPYILSFSDFVRDRGRVKRAIVATDSRRVRRTIQADMPLEVVDASTTDIREIIVHSHRQPTDGACLACIYRHIPDEVAREREIAQGLGISVEDIAQGFVSAAIAAKIVRVHSDLDPAAIVGMAFDSLFKQRCAEQRLPSAAGVQVLAPFAFVSNLAGAYLALEVVRLNRDALDRNRTNYFFLSPWAPPNARARIRRPRESGCSFCAKPQALEAMKTLWTDQPGGA